MRIPTLVAALFAVTTAAAADRPCSASDATSAGKAIDRVMTWEQLHKSWQDWHQCDTGPTSDLYTDALLRLAVDWKNVDALANAMRGDKGYHDFVLAHLKSDAAKDDRDAVYSRAKTGCPPNLKDFCGEIADAAKGVTAKAETLNLELMQPIRRAPAKPADEKK